MAFPSITFPQRLSYGLAAVVLLAALLLHLVPALIAGLMVHVLVHRISARFLGRLGSQTGRVVVTALLALVIGLGVVAAVTYLASQLEVSSGQGLTGLWTRIADIVASAQTMLPAWMVASLPSSADDIQAEVVRLLKEHTAQLQSVGKDIGVGVVHTLIGSVIGGLLAVQSVSQNDHAKPLPAALRARCAQFARAFERVFLGQGRIAVINATCTAIYLMLVLPLAGVHLPFVKTIVLLTLVVGFIPVVGNLVSNFAIVVVSASVSIVAALASLVFLVVLHKAEYLLSARIVGSQINARAWEMLSAMVVMEAAFGVPGLVTAPMIYAYIKAELSELDLI